MGDLGFQIASAYRALESSQRAFVDATIARAESAAVVRKVTVAAVLDELRVVGLPQREQDYLASPLVRAAIFERCREIDDRNSLTEYKILRADQMIIEASIDHFMNEDLSEFDLTLATPDQRLAIESLEITEQPNGTRKYKLKLYSKHPSLQRLTEIAKMRGGDSLFWQNFKRESGGQITDQAAVGGDQKEQEAAYSRLIDQLRG